MHLGHITDAGCEANKQALMKMSKAGFRLSVWKELQRLLQSQENAAGLKFMEDVEEDHHHL